MINNYIDLCIKLKIIMIQIVIKFTILSLESITVYRMTTHFNGTYAMLLKKILKRISQDWYKLICMHKHKYILPKMCLQ